jgi:hypothetical protein
MHEQIERDNRRADQAEMRKLIRMWKFYAPFAALFFVSGFLTATTIYTLLF